MSATAGNVLRSRAASELLLTAALPGADTTLVSAVPTTAARNAAKPFTVSRVLARRLALPALFVVAAAYHAWQSLGHVTPMVFDDELLYGKLSQSIAAGHGLSIRGEPFFFPAPLGPLVQSPVWLLSSMTDAYTAAKILNAAVMSAAVFPAYWLARRIVRPSFALLTAAAAVATPAMVYHAFLMSEALAYPVFLLTVAVLAKALAEPSRRMAIAVPAVCLIAIATRVQFLILPLVYVAAVALCGRGNYRRHALPAALGSLLVGALLFIPGALGTYGGATHLRPSLGPLAHWVLVNGTLFPYALGLAVVPGAILGLGYMIVKPRNKFDRATATLTVGCLVLFIGQAALVSTAEAHRPLERYLFYCTPLVFLAFFSYVERGAPRRFMYVALGLVGALALSRFQLTGLTGTTAYFFDGITLTGFARVAFLMGLTNAALLYALIPLALALLAWALPLRKRGVPELFASLAIGLSLAAGVGVYATDSLATSWAARTFGSKQMDWLDRSNLGPARQLILPRSNIFARASLETWNRNFSGVVVLATDAPDRLPEAVARIRTDGTLEIDGAVAGAQTLVANIAGSSIDLEGKVVARPRIDLVAYRIPAGAHVRSLTWGLEPDRWMGTELRFRAWPGSASTTGRYEITLALPKDKLPRTGELMLGGKRLRKLHFVPGQTLHLTIPAGGSPTENLSLSIGVPETPLDGRVLGLKVVELRYVTGKRTFDALHRSG